MKDKLRQKYSALRNELSNSQIEEKSLEIANRLLELPIWNYSFYHLFLSISEKKEIDTEPLLHILQGKDKNIVLSKSNFTTRELTNYLLTDSTVIKKNEWNIPEPVDGIEIPASKIDLIFVPLMAFDLAGHRVGYGKGFYDIFLSSCRNDVIKIGLSLFEAEEEIPGLLNSDIPMNYCITPNKTYFFEK
ncbi:5-formyltetrahydrofolate cyclo-ligase [Antarcticibacterium sp. 1MA-6-2]|uniref:5-formyltetrahydrofolate cyclo-ligase n=1 Tax=Antarcticibacterium sp. 1MA-6-2 TaxID=2908210 RepID=UPI001F29A1DE|nr:5-formyltetrahydrofolate cyclo-ligase [Antarcticibacterium sp. 1MA-6-2]UJH90306.1 5-formyltetrahydrofolate cyclo-ligase [Antarcticibacterium sp. 1MA-6-2]